MIVAGDHCILTADHTELIHARVKEAPGLLRERFVLSVTHSHTTPMLTGAAPTPFGAPGSPAHQANIDRYSTVFIEGDHAQAMQ